jgi:hypothetical protein
MVDGPMAAMMEWISGEVSEWVISRAVRCMRSRGMSQRSERQRSTTGFQTGEDKDAQRVDSLWKIKYCGKEIQYIDVMIQYFKTYWEPK